ncbi:MAG: sensor histidine kinase [Bacteroidota bacterium]|jgi:signal transduction histidine kinase
MRLLLLIVAIVLQSLSLLADAGEPLRLVIQRSFSGRLITTNGDTARSMVVYQRPAWDRNTTTLAVYDEQARGSEFTDRLPQLEVVDAARWRSGILVLHRAEGRLGLRWMSASDQSLQTADVAVPASVSDSAHRRDRLRVAERLMIGPDGQTAVINAHGTLLSVELAKNVLSLRPVENGVLAAGYVALAKGSGFVMVYRSGPSAFLALLDSSMRITSTVLVPLSDVVRFEQVGSSVLLYSSLDGANGCVVTVLDLETRTMTTRSVPVDASRVTGLMTDGVRSLALLTTRSGRAEVVVVPLSQSLDDLPEGTFIPGEYGSPRLVRAFGDTVMAVFTGGVAIVTGGGEILARDAIQLPVSDLAEVVRLERGYEISSPSYSVRIIEHPQRLWFVSRSWEWLLRYVIPMLFLSTLGVLYFVYRRQKRFLEAMIDAPGSGAILFIDVNGRLLRTNDRAAALLRITQDVPMGRMYSTYMNQPGLAQLSSFIDRVRLSRESHSERISTLVDDELRELIMTSTPIVGTLGSSRGLLFAGVDITETLEQRRLTNWAQLAHDMQTNLSTIRLNAEQIQGDVQRGDDERRRRILFQVGVLIDRVRDLLGVARSEVFQRTVVHSAELCTEVRHEFDAAMFPHVTFSMKLRGTLMLADRLKLTRAVRNAVENAIKALRNQQGTVEISTWFDHSNVFISVSDTGVGMDPETMANMMKPYFSSSTDGTGHGIGTMIMHHVTKLHGGRIRVTSEPGKGTQIVFRIPHGMEPKEKIRATTAERVS